MVKSELEKIKNVRYEKLEDKIVVYFEGVKIFDLDKKTENIIYAYIGNIKSLDKSKEDEFMNVFTKFVGL